MQRRTVAVILSFVLISVGAGAVFVVQSGDSPSTVDVESWPHAPELPATLNAETAPEYATEYEQRYLYNSIVSENGHSLHEDDTVVNVCRSESVTELNGTMFQVEVRCAGGLQSDDHSERETIFEYRATYNITETAVEKVSAEGFPYEHWGMFGEMPSDRPANQTDAEE